jgi:two-component system cell cycle sensor histidine kinase/response regulator CckA
MSAGHILVLDDDRGMCETIGDVLEQRGYVVQIATEARAGLEIAAASPIEAAIVDIKLPDMSGIDVLHGIRKVLPTTEIIFITGHASLTTAIQAINGLAFAYLVKPFEMSHLLMTVEQAVRKQRLAQALLDSDERYRFVTENIADAVFLLDLDGRIALGNHRAEMITGYAQAELVGRAFFSLLPEAGAREARARLSDVRAGVKVSPFFEVELIQKDGARVLLEVHVTSVLKDGQPVARLGVARDITERRYLEDQLRQAQKMEGIGRLAAGVAHDFNNLLTAIGGRCYLVLNALTSENPIRREIEIIQDAAERAAKLTHQLLAFSRKQILDPCVLDLNATVTGIEPLLRRMIREDIEIATALDSAAGRVKADAGQIEQVLLNLAVNASDAMPNGGWLTLATSNVTLDEAYARTHAEVEPGPYVMLSVSDTGHGMTAEVQAHIFEPFFTTKEVGKGTGLGLATAYGIAKQSGGHITVHSEPGHGAVFKLYLPRVEEGPGTAEPARPTEITRRGSETVLLVEDDEPLRTLAREILSIQGYTVLDAISPSEALRLADVHPGPIHLLLTDVVMPQMNGRQVADHLLAARPGLKVLFMSGYTDAAIVEHGVLEPGTHFLQKPFTPDGLLRRVREVLDADRGEAKRDAWRGP